MNYMGNMYNNSLSLLTGRQITPAVNHRIVYPHSHQHNPGLVGVGVVGCIHSQIPTVLAAAPLSSSCVFCNAEVVENLSRSTIQVPVQVKPSTGFLFPSVELSNIARRKTIRLLEENELLKPNLVVPAYHYLPPLQQKKSACNKRRLEENPKFTYKGGLDHWYVKRRQVQVEAASTSKMKQFRVQKKLKRLQSHASKREWRIDKRLNFDESEAIRESKFKMLQRKGIKRPLMTECPLWNCPRKEYRRKRPFTTSHIRTRSVSRLSNLSVRSRSPIIFSK